jgi:DNA-binding NarL/FixJ family response regulator
MSLIRVLIADDHPLMRKALRTIIVDEADLELVGEVDNGQDAIAQALALRPDVIMIDLYIPLFDGIEVVKQVMAANPAAHLLVLTSSVDDTKVAEAVQAGALGYLIKDSDGPEILHAIREVGNGRGYLSPVAAAKLASGMHKQLAQRADNLPETLTNREREILEYVRAGDSNAHIARELQIGEATVRTHIHNILRKLGFETRSQLMMYLLSQKNRQA